MKLVSGETSLAVFERLKSGEASGTNLAEELGISRTAVWKAIEKIRSAGYCVEAKKGKGYRLASSPEFPVYEVTSFCFSRGFEEFYFFEEIDSTNTFLKRLVSERPVRAVAVALRQTAGRGRLGRKWVSRDGGLYLSLSFPLGEVSKSIEDVPKVTLSAGVAVCRALKTIASGVFLKWPNDVLLEGKKLSGILCELCGETENPWIIVGVGVNVSNDLPAELNATNLKGYGVTVSDVCFKVLSSLFSYLKKSWEEVRKEWMELAEPMLGKKVEVVSAGKKYSGIAAGIDERGALILIDGSTEIRVFSGDCFYGGDEQW